MQHVTEAFLKADAKVLQPKSGFFGAMGERGLGGAKCGATAAVALVYAVRAERQLEYEGLRSARSIRETSEGGQNVCGHCGGAPRVPGVALRSHVIDDGYAAMALRWELRSRHYYYRIKMLEPIQFTPHTPEPVLLLERVKHSLDTITPPPPTITHPPPPTLL